ncbi:MAG: energy-coupling factor transporter transmembrane protein EcfT [Halobacteriales archaeon]|nr:energy-coupling factor transporter transmembrane protein EcfT [Halobacteriales archaeon]
MSRKGRAGFAYRDGDTFLHTADARAKLVALVVVSLALTWASAPATVSVGVLAYVVALSAGVQGREVLRDVRLVLLILVVGAGARALSDPEGIVAGAFAGTVASGRFVVIIALAYVVSATTRPADVRLAVESFLAPVPFVNEKDWGTMFAVAARFFPLVSDEVRRVREARKARLGDEQRWYTRVRSTAFASLTRSFRRADTLALAMESRGYDSRRTSLRSLEWKSVDTAFVVVSCGVGVLAYVF